MNTVRPVDFVFFDETYVYSTSAITIKDGEKVNGANLMNLRLSWKKALHHDTIRLPNKMAVPVGIMSYASEGATTSDKPFFVMPLPSFWKAAGVDSKELGLHNLLTGVFLHEFAHSQQMQNFGRKISAYEKQYRFEVELNDDIVQHLFGKDTAYVSLYKKERDALFGLTEKDVIDNAALAKALTLVKERQGKYFHGTYENLTELDNFFLTMEGIGQYSMFVWLTHSKGGQIPRELAIKGVRRGGKWWSQDEGLALFLILEKLAKPGAWAKQLFGRETVIVMALIEKYNK
jgi:hypothetical protein